MNLSMLKQAQELKSKLDKVQKELSNTIVEADSGRGAVKVTINGQQKILSIKISPEVIDPNKANHLEELVLKAVTEAIAKSQKAAAKQLSGLTGGLKIPGLT
ncbi:MAG: YbaB/EbfC family nucleoid-associated protein [Dehalococcoidales bacterium]|nr:YbaB/EbfC family nucleoid-associated protein [Dehalococcoidales bacterium]